MVLHTILFQFPSNGKAYPKETSEDADTPAGEEVSIPFKRESLSKDYVSYTRSNWYCFNSLQTGKPIQRLLSLSNESE